MLNAILNGGCAACDLVPDAEASPALITPTTMADATSSCTNRFIWSPLRLGLLLTRNPTSGAAEAVLVPPARPTHRGNSVAIAPPRLIPPPLQEALFMSTSSKPWPRRQRR